MQDILDLTLSDLDLDTAALMAQAAPSRKALNQTRQVFFAEVVREISPEDVLASELVKPPAAPPLQELRARHHRLAKMIAEGHPQVWISRMTGYTAVRIGMLMKDPAFLDLVTQYRTVIDDQFVDTVAKMKNLTEDAIDILAERMETQPESITNTLALEVIKTVGDRAGYSPVAKSMSVSATLDPSHLDQIKERIAQRQIGKVSRLEAQCSPDAPAEE